MANKPQNIKVVEGNAFELLLPLKARTYTQDGAYVDTDIDATLLQDVVVKIGSTEYTPSLGTDGVTIQVPATLAKGTYDIVLTATYVGSAIRAAYFQAITIVSWNNQADAEQYIAGSPIVADAAFVLGGALTDAELEQLKQTYAELNAQVALLKAELQSKISQINGVAQESTSQEIKAAVAGIDFSTLAKQGSNANATNTAILAAIDGLPTEQYMRNLYSARFEQNTDGQDTYTMVMPIVAGVAEDENGVIITL